jgi:hypothetical protein
MKWQPLFTDFFVSPVTGRITLSALPPLTYQTFWRGDINNRPVETGDADIGGFRLKNLASDPVEDFDAVSFNFLWNILHDEVEILWP